MKKIFLIVACLFCFGCASVYTRVPTGRFDSPETPGENLHKRLGFGLGGTHEVTLVSDASARPPILNNAKTTTTTEIPVRFSLGFTDRIEAGARYGILTGIAMLFGKFQFTGDPAWRAKEGNFSTSIFAAIGGNENNNKGDQNGTFGPGGYPWTSKVTTTLADIALILGYRVNNYFLIFGGPFATFYTYKGSINQQATADGTSPAADYPLNGSGRNTGANLAFQLGKPAGFSLTVEGTYSTFDWSSASTARDLQGGLLFEWGLD